MNDPIVNSSEPSEGATPPTPDSDSLARSKVWWLIVSIVVLAVIALAGAYAWHKSDKKTASQNRVVRLGLLAPLTGDDANYGQAMQHGVEMAQQDFNQQGLSFQIYVRDTQCDPPKATAASQELADLKVTAIIGDLCSSSTAAALPLANQHHIVLISPGASTPTLSVANDYFFRTIPIDSYEGPFTATYMTKRDVKSIAIFHSNEAYGNGLDKAMVSSFESQGGKVVADDAFTPGDVDFTAQLPAIKAANPAALYIVTDSEVSGAAIVTEARQAGLTMPIYCSDGLRDAGFINDIGKNSEGMTIIDVSPGSQSFISEYKATYNSAPAATAAQAYDAFTALAKVASSGAVTGEQIKQALPRLDFQGKSGEIKFNKYGDLASGGYTVYVVKNGQFEIVANP